MVKVMRLWLRVMVKGLGLGLGLPMFSSKPIVPRVIDGAMLFLR